MEMISVSYCNQRGDRQGDLLLITMNVDDMKLRSHIVIWYDGKHEYLFTVYCFHYLNKLLKKSDQ